MSNEELSDTMVVQDSRDIMLTTIDNPYNPFEDYDSWYRYDTERGYNTSGIVARFTKTSSNISDELNRQAVLDGIMSVLDMFPDGFYKVVYNKV